MPLAPLPEYDTQLLEQFAVKDRLECIQWLSRLCSGGNELVLHPMQEGIESIHGHIQALDEAAGHITIALDRPLPSGLSVDAFTQTKLTAVTVLDAVKIQFTTVGLGRQTPAGEAAAGPVLHLKLPTTVYRLQRRNAYRIVPPEFAPASLWLATPDEPAAERRVHVADLSATGLAFRWPLLAGEAPIPGQILEDCRLELAGTVPIRCALLITDTQAPGTFHTDPDARIRVGCHFSRIDPASGRAVQMYVDSAQRRLKSRKPIIESPHRPERATDPAQAIAARQTQNSAPRSDGRRSAQST